MCARAVRSDDVVVDRVADRNDGGEDWLLRCLCVRCLWMLVDACGCIN